MIFLVMQSQTSSEAHIINVFFHRVYIEKQTYKNHYEVVCIQASIQFQYVLIHSYLSIDQESANA